MATLYDLTSEYQELLEMIQSGEYDPETLADTLEGLDGEVEIKADGYAKVIKEIEGNIAIIKAEIDRLSTKKSALDNSIKSMKQSLELAMKATGKVKFKTELFSFNIAKNGGKQSLDVYDEVPVEYCKTVISPDSDKIRLALDGGQVLSFAILQERGESLRIK